MNSANPMARILVVDDEEPIRRFLCRVLELAGHQCTSAGSAAEARELLATNDFAMALCDLTLPDAPGLGLVSQIAADHPSTAVIIVTGTDDPAVARDAIELGAYGYVVKPFERNEILITVHTCLQRRRLELDALDHSALLEQQVARRTAELSEAVASLRTSSEELRRRDEWFRSLAECTPSAILALDEHGACIYANAAARAYSQDDAAILGDGWQHIVHPDDAVDFMTWMDGWLDGTVGENTAERDGSDVEYHEFRVIDTSGENRWMRGRIAAIRGDDGRPNGFVLVAEDVTAERAATDELERLARTDSLTGLPNRSLLLDRLATPALDGTGCATRAVLFVDLDRFKLVNDTHGHTVGDQVLRVVATRLCEEVGRSGMVTRLGGDEFVVLVEEVASPRSVIRLAERVLAAVRAPLVLDGREFLIGATIGLVFSSEASPQKVLADADIALHRAKELGGNSYEIFDESMRRTMAAKLQLESRLRRALDREEFELVYQPEFFIDGRLAGFEALLRWDDPEVGAIAPSDFIPVAEESGLIVPLGRWVLNRAAQQARMWNDLRVGEAPLVMSVNLSALQIRDPLLVSDVASALDRHRLPPEQLCLEITETVIMDSARDTIPVLEGLHRLGVQLAVDDFGTGYSSLSYLAELPVDYLKADRSFVNGAGANAKSQSILGAVIQMAHGLGLRVVAEGVENTEQLTWLAARGCDIVQGFLLGRPRTAERCAHWIEGGLPHNRQRRLTPTPTRRLAPLAVGAGGEEPYWG